MRKYVAVLSLLVIAMGATPCHASLSETQKSTPAKDTAVDFQWDVRIPMRDGITLAANVYRPEHQQAPLPCIFTLTPYVAQTWHDRGMYFASHGYVFLTVDTRGRGNSDGSFTPFLQEANDGPQVVAWLARQPYCNGKVAMWGGSYAGYDQWETAKELPPHLVTIVPVAAPRPGIDFPAAYNIFYAYDMQWLTETSGHTMQGSISGDDGFWNAKIGSMYRNHLPFKDLDAIAGVPSRIFHEWLAHPEQGAYWDSYSPTPQQFAKIDLPILTITGQYDGDQPGALSFYDEYFKYASDAAKAKHYLVIGPWDHFGTRTPDAEFGGIQFGKAALIDMNGLLKGWYDWTMKGGPKPTFLKNKVVYYFFGDGIDEWRSAASLADITASMRPMYLSSVDGSANDVFASGSLEAGKPSAASKPDHYVYNPLDVQLPAWDPSGDETGANFLTGVHELLASSGKLLVYHTAPFKQDMDLAGFFKLTAWIAINQPDTDIAATVYAIMPDGHSELLATDALRARYRKSLRTVSFAKPGVIEKYDFDHFTFIARRLAKGSRLRLVIGPVNAPDWEKNYNTDGVVADESGKDARTVTVALYHDSGHPSALFIPIAKN